MVKSEPQGTQVKQEPRVKQEQHVKHEPQHTHSKLPSSPLKPPKREKDGSENKRKSAGGSSSDEKKPRLSSRSGGLFSPSPERKPAAPSSMKSPLLSPNLTSPVGQGKRTRTISTSSNGEAMVNVQKLENIAPEFQHFKGTHGPASILVGPDGQPSPKKGPEESAGTGAPVAHQPWVQASTGSTTTPSVPNHNTSPHKPVKKEDVSPVKGGSGHKKERRSSGDSHSEKKRSSSGHHRSEKHISKSASVPQVKTETSDPVPPPPSLSDSPAKQVPAIAAAEHNVGQDISPSKKDDEEKRKHRDKKDDKHKKKKEKKEKKEKKDKKDKKERKEGDEKKEDKVG